MHILPFTSVSVRNSHTRRERLQVYLSPTDDTCWEQDLKCSGESMSIILTVSPIILKPPAI